MSRRSSPDDPPKRDLTGTKAGPLLTVEAYLGHDGRDPDGSVRRLWICRCQCGGCLVMTGREVRSSRANGRPTGCDACKPQRKKAARERTKAMWHERDGKATARERYLRMWAEEGSLYSMGELERMRRDIRDEVAREIAPWPQSKWRGAAVVSADQWQPPDAPAVGYGDGEGMTLVDVAKALSGEHEPPLSRERVRQIESAALRSFAKGLYAIAPDLFEDGKLDLSKILTSADAGVTRTRSQDKRRDPVRELDYDEADEDNDDE